PADLAIRRDSPHIRSSPAHVTASSIVPLRHAKAHRMLTAEQYRAKASGFATLLDDARSPAETRMFQELKQSYLALAENMDWMAANRDKTIEPRAESPGAQPRKRHRDSHVAPADRANILRRL